MQANENPFATDRVENLLNFRPGWSKLSWGEIESRWSNANYRCAITGRHGAGKTTLLTAWKQRLREADLEVIEIFLNRESRSLTVEQWDSLVHPKLINSIVILDGEEQLGYISRRRFYKISQTAKGVIITRHSKNHFANLIHLAPEREVLHQCVLEIAPEHYARLSPYFDRWWKDKKGNIREILLACYDAV